MTTETKINDTQLSHDVMNTDQVNGKGEQNNHSDDSQQFYSKEEVEKLLQQEADRRVSQARKKFEAEFQTKLEKERKEAEKLAKLSEEEKLKLKMDAKVKELEQREQELLRKEIKLETAKILSEKGLPVEMIDTLVGANADETMNNIEAFENAFRKAVEDAVNKRLGAVSGTPGTGSAGQIITKEDFKKLDYRGRLRLMNEDPELYNKLSKELD